MRVVVAVLLASLLNCGIALAGDKVAGDKVVYQINDAARQALKGLRNMANQLDVAPNTKIVVVAYGDGVEFLLDGAKDPKHGISYGPLISDLANRGVDFEVCQVTMRRKHLTKNRFVMEANFTPSGVVRLTELQYREHYAYIRP